MKKSLLCLLVALISMSASANRKWDFTSWSSATVANLMAGAFENAGNINPESGWTDVEKTTQTAPTDVSKNNCFWEVTAQGNATSGAAVQANKVDIAELSGLFYTNTAARSLAIAVNYQEIDAANSFGPYHGGAYLWLGSNKKNYFVIPDVKPGAVISMGVESHKTTDARGVELYIVKKNAYGTKGAKLKDPDGNDVPIPTVYTEQKWLLPEEVTDEASAAMVNEDGTYDILIYNTNGCHLYFINVAEAGDVAEDRNVAWVSPYDEPENDDELRAYAPTDGINYTAINSTTEGLTAEALREYDAVVISTGVSKSDAAYNVLKENIAYMPIVNLNGDIFGYTKQETGNVQLVAQVKTNSLYEGINVDEETGEFEYADVAYTLPEQFANDLVLAKNGEFTAFHQHGTNRNIYIFLPSTADLEMDLWGTLFVNAVNMAAKTKRSIEAAATPSVSLSYADGKTTATPNCGTSGAVLYVSTDGENYTAYTNPVEFTAEGTLYVYAEAEGYTRSEIASKAVDIKSQMAAPEISQSHETNSTSITLSADGDAKIYYSFINETNTANMALYTAPVTVSEPCKIYAVAISDMTLQSEQVSAVVNIDGITSENIRIDTLAHMDVNQAEYYEKMKDWSTEKYGTSVGTSASAFYFFGKSAWNYYLLDEEGNVKKDSTMVDGVWQYTYYPNANSLVSFDFGNGWMLKSGGQVGCIECIDAVAKVGHGETERRADSAEDLIYGAPTKGLIDFNGKKTGEPWTLSIETTAKYQGPFDIVTYLGNGSTGDVALVAQVSTDGETWQTIDTLAYSKNQRYWKRGRMSYEGTDEVYFRVTGGGSKGQLYDIYLLNNGELSKQWKPATDTKVGDVNNDDKITMSDANAIVNYFLAEDKTSITNFNVEAADANNDGSITMSDANAVVNMYLGGEQ